MSGHDLESVRYRFTENRIGISVDFYRIFARKISQRVSFFSKQPTMKTFKLLAIAVIAILFASCKASQPTGPPSGGTALVSQVGQTLDTIENQFMLEFDSTNSDDHAALQRTGNWLAGRTNIQSVSVLNSTYLYFTLQSGLTGMYYLNEVDDSGMSLTRGGPGGGGSLSKWSVLSAKTISNTNVLIFAPVFNEFYSASDFQYVLNILQNFWPEFECDGRKRFRMFGHDRKSIWELWFGDHGYPRRAEWLFDRYSASGYAYVG